MNDLKVEQSLKVWRQMFFVVLVYSILSTIVAVKLGNIVKEATEAATISNAQLTADAEAMRQGAEALKARQSQLTECRDQLAEIATAYNQTVAEQKTPGGQPSAAVLLKLLAGLAGML